MSLTQTRDAKHKAGTVFGAAKEVMSLIRIVIIFRLIGRFK